MKISSLLMALLLACLCLPGRAADLFADSNCKAAYEYHFLNRATAFGDIVGAEILLQGGASPDGIGYERVLKCIPLAGEFSSPLSLAVRHKDLKFVQLLLKWGADPNFLEGESTTPTKIARSNDSIEILDLLIKHGGK